MEENIALDSQKQKKFVKSIKGIKKLIKKNEVENEPKGKNEEEQKPQKPFSMRLNDGKVKKRKHKERGLVYLGHIPHGFYEHQMTQYFKQFGVVTNVRVIRSKRTGNSKGYAFVEFKDTAVGEIVAETMNNYLMGKRLIKAAYIPPEKQRKAFRKRWNSSHNPASVARLKIKKAHNADKDESGELNRAKKYLKNLNKTKKKLSEMGINYDFFTPVDIPEGLLNKIVKQEKDDSIAIKNEDKKKTKKGKKAEEAKEIVSKNTKVAGESNKTETSKKIINKKGPEMEKLATKVNNKDKVPAKVNKQEQKEKQQKLKDAGVKPVEEFIKIQEESDDSDSSYDFDSDEYDKVLEQDDDDISSGESEDDNDVEDDDESENDEGDDDEEEGEEEVTQKQVKGKPPVPVKQAKGKPPVPPKPTQPHHTKKQAKQQDVTKKLPQEFKRKAPQKVQGSPKKPKFEKQNQKPMKKQFKKK